MSGIPPEILKNHVAILGKTGSGKTSTEKLCIEQVVANGFRVCVLDSVKSDWWGITSSASGKEAGLPFQILGGPHGHVPLHSSAGKVIGQLVGTGKLPLSIIDMADFEAGGLQRFFIDFAQSLMRSVKGVIYLVIEEAHEFAPKERSGIGQENMAIHCAKKLATAGRSKGIRMIVATQRIQALHNAVLGSCETIIAHRLSAPADQEPISKWLKANTNKPTLEKVMGSLSSLPTGSGWVCAGEAKIFEMMKFPKFKTYDNTATPEGDSVEVNIKTAPVDQEALRAIIGDAIKEAVENDPLQLKRQLAQLQKELREKSNVKAFDVAKATELEFKANQRGKIEGYKSGVLDCAATLQERVDVGLQTLKTALLKDADSIIKKMECRPASKAAMPPYAPRDPSFALHPYQVEDLHNAGVKAVGKRIPIADLQTATQKMKDNQVPPNKDGDYVLEAQLTKAQEKIIDSLIFWRSVGNEAPGRPQVAAIAGYSYKSSTFRNPLYNLSVAGLIKLTGKQVTLTTFVERGAISSQEAARQLRNVLSATAQKLAAAMAHEFDPISREQLADQTNYSVNSSTFRNPLYKLSVLNVIELQPDRMVTITNWARGVLNAA